MGQPVEIRKFERRVEKSRLVSGVVEASAAEESGEVNDVESAELGSDDASNMETQLPDLRCGDVGRVGRHPGSASIDAISAICARGAEPASGATAGVGVRSADESRKAASRARACRA